MVKLPLFRIIAMKIEIIAMKFACRKDRLNLTAKTARKVGDLQLRSRLNIGGDKING